MQVTKQKIPDLTKDAITHLTASELTKSALIELGYRNINAWRNNNVRAVAGRVFTGKKGVSDIIGFHKKTGVFFAGEVKAGKDKLSADQIDFLQAVSLAGGIAVVVHQVKNSIAITEIKEYLNL